MIGGGVCACGSGRRTVTHIILLQVRFSLVYYTPTVDVSGLMRESRMEVEFEYRYMILAFEWNRILAQSTIVLIYVMLGLLH